MNSRAVEKQYLEKLFIQTGHTMRFPYTVCIGGCLTFSITETSIGNVVKVREGITGETIDLSDYEYL